MSLGLRCGVRRNGLEIRRAARLKGAGGIQHLLLAAVALALSHRDALALEGFLYNHFYTAVPAERDVATHENGFLNESDLDPIYLFTKQVKGSVQLYRLFNTKAGDHFYTTNGNERNDAEQNGWADESYAYPLYVFHQTVPDELRPHAVQLRRFWIPDATDHFYATDQQDAKNARNAGGREETNRNGSPYSTPPWSMTGQRQSGCGGFIIQVQQTVS